MNIDRAKLNSLLKSGLNPDIKTRKQLAAELGLDPTSLTRWFSHRDRLGNARHPVVPDRHVGRLLQIFELSSDVLNLDTKSFHQYCLDVALQRANDNDVKKQKAAKRFETITSRKIDIASYTSKKQPRTFPLFAVLGGGIIVLGSFLFTTTKNDPESINKLSTIPQVHAKCWQGYSAELGTFKSADPADPCHYAKLYQAALSQLSHYNEQAGNTQTTHEIDNKKYLNFLSNQLDQRRIGNKIYLNVELAKSALRQGDVIVAQQHMNQVESLLAQLPSPPESMLMLVNVLSKKLKLTPNETN